MESTFQSDMSEVFDRYVGRAFGERFAKSVIVADRPFSQALADTPTAAKLVIVPKEAALRDPRAAANRELLLCLSAPDETFEQAIRRRTAAPVLSVWRDWVLPRVAKGSAGPPSRHPANRKDTSYSILTQPRAGSTFLCYQLQTNGLGVPGEHVRGYLPRLIERRLITTDELLQWWNGLTIVARNNGLFGTKLIFGFYKNLLASTDGAQPLVSKLILGAKMIRLKRDLIDVSVSDFIAHEARAWHLFPGIDLTAYARALAQVNIDDRALLARYERVCRDEAAMDAIGADFDGDVLEVQFEPLTNRPREVVAKISGFLETRPVPTAPALKTPTDWSTHSAVHVEAAARLRHLIGQRSRSP